MTAPNQKCRKRRKCRKWMVLFVALAGLALQGCGGIKQDYGNFDRFIGQEPPRTFLLIEYTGPLAGNDAERVRREMIEKGLPKAFVIADEDEAFLCYGLYDDNRKARTYLKDKRLLASVRDSQGRTIFGSNLRVLSVLLPETTPRSRYDLVESAERANRAGAERKALPKRYTVRVGSFNLYGRKHAATEYAEQLRRKGFEAYVFHGPAWSHVTVGLFDNTIFDDWHRMSDPMNPPKIVSGQVNGILRALPRQNLDGHLFTEKEGREVREAEARAKAKGRRVESYSHFVFSAVTAIPKRTP